MKNLCSSSLVALVAGRDLFNIFSRGFSIKETPCHALYTFYNILLMSDPEGNSFVFPRESGCFPRRSGLSKSLSIITRCNVARAGYIA